MKVGIIGGVSPFACSNFYNSFCERYRKKNNFYPNLLIYSIKVSLAQEEEFLYNNVSDSTLNNIKSEIDKACLFFKKNDIEIVTICCNTLSNIFYEIASKYNFKLILTPVNSVNNYIVKNNKKGLLLSTSFTSNQQLYKNVETLTEEDQKVLYQFLKNKINTNYSEIKINDFLKKYNFDFIILGCTDITKNDISLNTIIIDSNECLLKDLLIALGEI